MKNQGYSVWMCALWVVVFVFSGAVNAERALVRLEIELPAPSFGGEPLSYYGPNLEESDFRNRPPLLVPKGTFNVAAGRPVTSSVPPIHGHLEQITNGDKSYRRASVVELPEGLQWVQIDLEAEQVIYAIVLWHFHENLRVYHNVIVQVSNDKHFEDGVATVFNNDYDDSSGLGLGEDKNYVESHRGRLIHTDARVSGRYVRLYSMGNHKDEFNHFIEVEVYGYPGSVRQPDSEQSPDAGEYVPLHIELPEPAFM